MIQSDFARLESETTAAESEAGPTFDEFIGEELAVQQIISYDKTDGGCNGGDLSTALDYVQNTASDSDYPETSNTQGRTHK